MSEEAAKAAENFCATINHNKQQEEDEFGQFMWADDLEINATACSIDNPECESCSG